MKLSELDAAFHALRNRVDRLVQGVESSEFDSQLNQLQAELRQLEAWTKPRGGGRFEVDIEPYISAGGAPRYMRDRASILLAAATTLRNARRTRTVSHKLNASMERDDLRVPLTASLKYSDTDVRKIQSVFKYLYSRRAYNKLDSGKVWVQSKQEDYLPANVQDIRQLSKHNLSKLRRDLAPLSNRERKLYSILHGLPFYLKHATTKASWENIFSARLIFSRDALTDWNIVVPTNTPGSDERYKQDVDFAFFRVEVGTDDWESRFGADGGDRADQVRIVFDWQHVLEDGWVTLHDMLAPLGIGDPRLELRTHYSGELLRVSEPDMDLEGGREKWIHWKWRHTYPGSDTKRLVHILDEVFYGPDILEGLVLSLVRDLRELPALQQEALEHLPEGDYETWNPDSRNYARWLIKSLFRVEAKYPSGFRFEPDTITVHPSGNPALQAAIDHAESRPK